LELIGFQWSGATDRSLPRRLSPSLVNRVALVDSRLRRAGYRLFMHSPDAIRFAQPTVPGFVFEEASFRPLEAEIPAVNGNWTHRTRRLLDRGMGYASLSRWVEENEIGIHVPYAFSELLANKLETYKVVRAYHEILHPHCELWTGARGQLEYFVEADRLTFIKPRNGNKGNRIITINREDRGLRVTYYDQGRRRERRASSLREVLALVSTITRGTRKYVIQHGVETMRHGASTFDIRVTMVHDGESWRCLHEARISPPGSDVSNVSQGGDIAITEALLFEIFGAEASSELLHDLVDESFGLAVHLEQLHPGDINEVAFDFAVDREGRLRLLEVNTKPGLAGIGSNVPFYDLGPEQQGLFARWAIPHVSYLADFLMRKMETRSSQWRGDATRGKRHLTQRRHTEVPITT
jgi:hypothetical protein